ncbi:hypothetical protein MTER_31540 [Mycolicibacter terrae]|uniref:Predicted hydrolase N-terminal domain-containing protein n=1 Tax=Mycolicibacter terrae TaxID=1788 RepID=A0AAD1MHS1_9MYCO|nr:glycine zipper domain-containing protein [Mycolicibacter terrae]ORW88654.1 hypothetical protein AWC28_05515 [Mycolicibacter terrae]BBX23743.1 hypothetical protein MTER_31540 [Mycolicibacter terrae]SNV60360.1 Uncharacterised protein [Mycolicibacter terrae]
MSRPSLQHLQIADLIAHGGGDPWALDDSLQAGSPTQINFLAQAFHRAAGSATAAEQTFHTAQQHFQQYNRENGEQPINNGAEVQRVKDGLHATNQQLGQIAADLETIAADLAQARAASQANITALNANLLVLDAQIGVYLSQASQGQNHDADIAQARQLAQNDTATALHNATVIRDGYSKNLQQAQTNLRVKDGYNPDIRKFDAEDGPAGGADGGAGGKGASPRTGAPTDPVSRGADGGGAAFPPWLPPGTPVMTRPGGPLAPPRQPAQVGGKWGNVGDGLAAAGERANVPANPAKLPGFVPGGSPSAAIPGGIPMTTALENVEKFGKRLGFAGNLVTGANGYFEFSNDLDNGVPLSTAVVDVVPKTVGDIGGGLVGATTGAEAGAWFGTVVAPGPGTVIGAGVGAVVGGVIGSDIGKKMGEDISDVSHSLWRSLFG